MGVKNLPHITAHLIQQGRSPETPVALIRLGTRPDQEVLTATLADIAEKARRAGFKAPAITVVGDVVRLREKLRWFDNRPLFGRGIMVTRAADQAGGFSAALATQGAQLYECPTIEIVPPADYSEVDQSIKDLAGFNWLVFTSANSVRFFFARMSELGFDSRAIGQCRVCAVGPKTAASLAPFGIRPDLVPADYRGEGVVEAFRALGAHGLRVLFPRADRARDVIPAGLSLMGAIVTAPVAYRNVTPGALPPAILQALEEGRIHCITFTSSSTAGNLAAMIGENRLIHLLKGVTVASIGPITSKTCRELGLNVHIEPREYTIEALTKEIVNYFSNRY